jgi:hypothetical protein
MPPMGVFLPAWAQQHARTAAGNTRTQLDDDDVDEDRMVQVASMTFTAPKMQLRVLNPDEESIASEDNFRRRISAGRQV